MDQLPRGLDLERHAMLHGRGRHPWYRRALFALVCLVPLLALTNLFGQDPSSSSAAGAEGTLTVQAPSAVRGGLMYQVRLDVTAARAIREPRLVLSPGWWQEMTENSTNPDPVDSSSSNGRVTLSYQHLDAGDKLTVWLQFQVNPIVVGKRSTNVQLDDGAAPVAHVERTMTVFP